MCISIKWLIFFEFVDEFQTRLFPWFQSLAVIRGTGTESKHHLLLRLSSAQITGEYFFLHGLSKDVLPQKRTPKREKPAKISRFRYWLHATQATR